MEELIDKGKRRTTTGAKGELIDKGKRKVYRQGHMES